MIMTATAWRDYEILTQTILREAHLHEGVSALTVEHDAQLQGKILTHQIDVLIRFEKDEMSHTVIVQCKYWNSAVEQAHLLTFAGVLDDLPDRPTGIFVTRKGYQAGALKLAEAKNIRLYTLRERTEKDAIVERIEFDITGYHPWSSEPNLTFDQSWLRKEAAARGMPSGEQVQIQFEGSEDQILLFDEDGAARQSLYDLKSAIYPMPQEASLLQEIPGHLVTHRFDLPTYVRNYGDARFPLVRLESVTYEIGMASVHNQFVVESENIVAYIMAGVLAGATATFDRELQFVAHFNKP
jgi:hypothetical protein